MLKIMKPAINPPKGPHKSNASQALTEAKPRMMKNRLIIENISDLRLRLRCRLRESVSTTPNGLNHIFTGR